MNWYLAKMVFRIICGEGNHTAQFDEQLRLISAASKAEAFHKAQSMGMKSEEIFFNQQQQLVKWQFISASEITMLQVLTDGLELCSRVEETDDADSYLKFIYAKAEQIRFGDNREILNPA
jgi:hypothetical protein